MDFEIRDGLIQNAINTFDHSLYGTEVLVPFTEWLNTNHPGDRHVMFFVNDLGEVNRSLVRDPWPCGRIAFPSTSHSMTRAELPHVAELRRSSTHSR